MNQATSATDQRRPEFVTLIAIYQFVTAGILFLLSCLIPVFIIPAIFVYIDVSEGVFASVAVAAGALALFIGFGFASVVVGWGLMRMREWARLGAIVLAAFALIGFPIWTIMGILVLVYLTSEQARTAFATANEKANQGDARHHDALAAQAVYKAEPGPKPDTSPLENTRPMRTTGVGEITREGPAPSSPSEESRTIEPIPMPPPGHEPEPASEQPTTELPAIEPDPPPTQPRRKWFAPPEEAGMDHRILRPREDEEDEEQ